MLGSVFVQCRLRPLTLNELDFTLAVLGGNDRPLWCVDHRHPAGRRRAFALAHGLRLGVAHGQ
jgi:hypothetical protein